LNSPAWDMGEWELAKERTKRKYET
jgi:hypothetical protein